MGIEKSYTIDLLVIFILFLPIGCGAGKVAREKAEMIEVHRPVVVEKTGQDDRPDWTTQRTFMEQNGNLVYTGGVMGGADYALTLRLARSEATKNLLESIQIKARGNSAVSLMVRTGPKTIWAVMSRTRWAGPWTISKLVESGRTRSITRRSWIP